MWVRFRIMCGRVGLSLGLEIRLEVLCDKFRS